MTKQFCANLFPRNHFHLTGVDLPDAMLDFFFPRRLNASIRLVFEAFEQLTRKLRPLAVRELDSFAKELFQFSPHGKMVTDSREERSRSRKYIGGLALNF